MNFPHQAHELIDTQWDVNQPFIVDGWHRYAELIDTQWDVNESGVGEHTVGCTN